MKATGTFEVNLQPRTPYTPGEAGTALAHVH